MARTFRRTDRYLRTVELPDRDDPTYVALAVRLHSDKPSFYSGPSRLLRRLFQRSLRQKAEPTLREALIK